MIILDSDVLSDLLKPTPNPNVVAWFKVTDPAELATTAITIGEMRFGLERMPKGRRRNVARAAFEELIDRSFLRHAIYPFDASAAYRYAEIAATLERMGRLPGSVEDMQIAAIALDRDAAVATGNIRDFENAGVRLVDPFKRRRADRDS